MEEILNEIIEKYVPGSIRYEELSNLSIGNILHLSGFHLEI